MKKHLFQLAVVGVLVVACAANVNAQKRKKPTKKATNTQAATQPVDTVPKQQPAASIPYENAPSTGNGSGLNDTIKVSLRNDNAVERNLVKDRVPLPPQFIREDDAVYKQRLWIEIDAREKVNLPFRYSMVEDNGNQRFVSILVNAIKSGVTAFDADADDRFTTPLTMQQALDKFGTRIDTTPSYDLNGNITKYVIAKREVSPDSIYKFRIKEEVVFDKQTSRLFYRILGIAPLMPVTLSDGSSTGQMRALFWLYYPDLRSTLAKYEVYNPKNFGSRMTWEDLFEGRMFSYYIVKSTIDNPFDRSLKDYIKDPLFRLLEGEKIKEKIFNYEQDLWQY
ncbi:gliding motility protein GldN [Chitinophagaceae bacterium LWZ2-11]